MARGKGLDVGKIVNQGIELLVTYGKVSFHCLPPIFAEHQYTCGEYIDYASQPIMNLCCSTGLLTTRYRAA